MKFEKENLEYLAEFLKQGNEKGNCNQQHLDGSFWNTDRIYMLSDIIAPCKTNKHFETLIKNSLTEAWNHQNVKICS